MYGPLPGPTRRSNGISLRCPPRRTARLLPPFGVDLPDDWVLVCLRAIYGLKQSPRLFNEHLCLQDNRKARLRPVNIKHSGDDFAIVVIVVDDILHAASSRCLLFDFSEHLSSIYKMSRSLGRPKVHDRHQDCAHLFPYHPQPRILHRETR